MRFQLMFGLLTALSRAEPTMERTFSTLIPSDSVRRIIVIPPSDQLLDRFADLIHRVADKDHRGQTSPQTLLDVFHSGNTDRIPSTLMGPQTVVVQMGGLRNVNTQEIEPTFSLLSSLEKIFGWRVFGIYSDSELALARMPIALLTDEATKVLAFVRDKYTFSLRFQGKESADEYNGPGDASTLFLSRSIGSIANTEWKSLRLGVSKTSLERLWYASDSVICQDALGELMHSQSLARIFIPSDATRSLCGSRLIEVSPDGFIVINMMNTRSVVLFDPLPDMIWPKHGQISLADSEFDSSAFDRVFVIPDIHGDLLGLVRTLWMIYNEVALQEGSVTWDKFIVQVEKGSPMPIHTNRIALVQLGDVIDRGPHTITCITVLEAVEEMFGWKLVRLYGNHELMNFHRSAANYIHPDDELTGNKRDHMFSFGGPLWRKLSSKLVMAARFSVRDEPGILFIHGGIDMEFFKKRNRIINQISLDNDPKSPVHRLNVFTQYVMSEAADLSHILDDEGSPLWTRQFEKSSEKVLCEIELPAIQNAFHVNKIIVGHSPQRSRKVRDRCGGKILLADTALSEWMGMGSSNPTALSMSFENGRLTGIQEMHFVEMLNDIIRWSV